MKTAKLLVLSIVVVFFALNIVGCGVAKEEHEQVGSDLEKARQDMKNLQAEMSGLEEDLNSAKQKTVEVQQAHAKQMQQAEALLTGAKKDAAELKVELDKANSAKAQLISDQVASKGQIDQLKAQVKKMTTEMSELNLAIEQYKVTIEKLKSQIEASKLKDVIAPPE